MLLASILLDGLVTGCLYALVAVGFSLLWWLTGIIHIAHGAVYLVAGYAMFALGVSAGLPFLLAMAGAIVTAVVAGAAVQLVIYRPFQRRAATEDAIITASLGILIIVQYVVVILFGPEGVSVDVGLRKPLLADGPRVLDRFSVIAILSAVAATIGLHFLLRRTNLGKAMRAAAENDYLAEVLGLPIRRIQIIAHALAAAMVVPAAILFLCDTGVHPPEALHLVLMAAVVAILGGKGSVVGALVGGVAVGIAESGMVFILDAGWRQLITFSLLYVLLLVRPQGLFGTKAA